MNGRIAFFIWLKGLALFAIGCILAGLYGMLFYGCDFSVLYLSMAIVVVALIISSPAILLYTVSLNVMKRANMGYKGGIIFLIITASVAVGLVDFILYWFGANLEEVFSYFFWIPLLFCIAAILISRKSIRFYLHPIEACEAFTIE